MNYNPAPWTLFGAVFTETWQTLKALITGYLNPKWLSGPVGIVQVLHHGWQLGVKEALFWLGAISVNLGFLNLLPIPILDGGYICLSLWELITRRKLKAKTMERLIIPFVVRTYRPPDLPHLPRYLSPLLLLVTATLVLAPLVWATERLISLHKLSGMATPG